jgi:hypothetical protein
MSNLFPTANCNAESIAFITQHVPSFAGTSAPPKRLGFHLIKETLVPDSFVEDVGYALSEERLNCFEVTKISDLFGDTYLESLSASELDVLGACVLLLIEQGTVPFSLIKTKRAA